MASARRLPTTPNISSYDSGGGKDYATLQGWEEATDIDLTAGGQSAGEILECYKGTHDDFDVLDGATTDSSYFRVIKPASGEGHLDINSGVPAVDGSMAAFVSTTNAHGFRISETFTQIHDLVGKLNIVGSSVRNMFFGSANDAGFIGCMALDCAISLNFSIGFALRNTAFAVNCLAIGGDGDGFRSLAETPFAYNCTAEGNALDNFNENAGTFTLKNCLGDNPGDKDYENTPAMITCGSSDVTGSAGLQNQTYTFVNVGADNFHYQAGSDGIGDGTDLSGDGTYAFDDDIDEDTRSAWDIGFDEFVAVAAGIVPILDHHLRMMRNRNVG